MAPIGKDHWLTRELLRQPDIVYANQSLVVTPVRNFLRQIIIFDHAEQNGFFGSFSISGLWLQTIAPDLDGFIGTELAIQRSGPVTILGHAPPMPSELLLQHLDQTTLPYLRSIDSLERFYQEATRNRQNLFDYDPATHFQLELVTGNFEEARKLLTRHRKAWFDVPVDEFGGDGVDHLRRLCRLLEKGDDTALAAALHECEAKNSSRLKLKRVWRPAPFAFEPNYQE